MKRKLIVNGFFAAVMAVLALSGVLFAQLMPDDQTFQTLRLDHNIIEEIRRVGDNDHIRMIGRLGSDIEVKDAIAKLEKLGAKTLVRYTLIPWFVFSLPKSAILSPEFLTIRNSMSIEADSEFLALPQTILGDGSSPVNAAGKNIRVAIIGGVSGIANISPDLVVLNAPTPAEGLWRASDIVTAIEWARNERADVILLALSGEKSSCSPGNDAVSGEMSYLKNLGIVGVALKNNMVPACVENIETVDASSPNAYTAGVRAIIQGIADKRIPVVAADTPAITNVDTLSSGKNIGEYELSDTNNEDVRKMVFRMVQLGVLKAPPDGKFKPKNKASGDFVLRLALAIAKAGENCGKLGSGSCFETAKQLDIAEEKISGPSTKYDMYALFIKAGDFSLMNPRKAKKNLCSDVKTSDPQFIWFATAYENKFLKRYKVKGRKNSCHPSGHITRLDAAVIAWKALQLAEQTPPRTTEGVRPVPESRTSSSSQ